MNNLLTLYARREPCARSERMLTPDIVIYRDEAMTNVFCRFDAMRSDAPDKRNRYVTLNCYKWRLQWLPDHPDCR